MAVLLPVGHGEGGVVEGGPHLTWPSEILRGGGSSCRWSQPGRSMLHPLVGLQPLFGGCFVVTKVTQRCHRDSCHLSNVVHCYRILLLVQIFLSPPGISPKSRRTWLLGSKALLSCLTPGVQGEGEVGTNPR